jgi:hypothetical protein
MFRRNSLERSQFAKSIVNSLPNVPVMSSTALGLEMLLHEPYVDLRTASEFVLSDIGATIQVLCLIRKEYDSPADRPSRMVDCLSNLDVDAWFAAISARTFACDPEHASATAIWRHSRLVAQYAQLVADSVENISAEDAYMVGLLHGISAIPNALGWTKGGLDGPDYPTFADIEQTLPNFVLDAMHSVNDSGSSSPWRHILTAAHDLADSRTDFVSHSLYATGQVELSLHGKSSLSDL